MVDRLSIWFVIGYVHAMRTAVAVAPGVMQMHDVEPPPLPPGHVRLRIEVVGLCGSDYHLFAGDHPYARFPQTLGHEFCGVVLELPEGEPSSLRVGQRVTAEPFLPCGVCFPCRRGRGNCCTDLRVMGAHMPGALAEEIVVRAGAVHPTGDLSPTLTALVEPVSIGLQAVRRGAVQAGDQVLIYGAGPIGLTAQLAAQDVGAQVMVVDREPTRLARATQLGASVIVDTNTEQVPAQVARWTHGDGPAVVIEATGAPVLFQEAFEVVAASGTVVALGISDASVDIPLITFSRKELTVVGSRNSTDLFPDAISLTRRHTNALESLVTHRFPFEEVGTAIDFARSHPEQVCKTMIDVTKGAP